MSIIHKIEPGQGDVTLVTPGFKNLSVEAFKARVIELLPYTLGGDPVDVPDELIDTVVAQAQEHDVGPYDTACEIVDRLWADRGGPQS